MRLHQLLAASGAPALPGVPDVEVTGLTSDSRAVGPGMLFAALPGSAVDGTAFIAQAIAKGAVAVLCGTTVTVPELSPSVALVRATEPRVALARMAASYFPRQPATIVAVTGTNGKTSIAEFTRQIWAALGHKAASLGTIGVVRGDGAVYGSLTTPDPITLHRTLQALADDGVTHLALEASSHGLDQYRLDGVRLAAGAFNNLGRDHLDYHPTMAAYLGAKLGLFQRLLKPGQPAIINLDGPEAEVAATVARARGLALWTIGSKGDVLRLVRAARVGFDQRVEIAFGDRHVCLTIPLIGDYQVSNALVAASLVLASRRHGDGQDPHHIDTVLRTLSRLAGVKGRLEVVGRHNGGIVVVDYAHKPEALAACLDALHPFATGKLICVFGCGGNRDKGKRPIMGAIAVEKSDIVIVTDDNPRHEDPAMVRAEILAQAKGAQDIGDRAAAIRAAIALLGPGDVLLVAGKGHETGQIVGSVTLPFSDHDVIAAAIREAMHKGSGS